MKHVWYKSGDGHKCSDWGECNLCVLSVCKICGSYEGGLTTDCPGVQVPVWIAEIVYNGKLDYRCGEGWVKKFSPCQRSHLYMALCDIMSGRTYDDLESEAEVILYFGATKEEIAQLKKEIYRYQYEEKAKHLDKKFQTKRTDTSHWFKRR